MRTRLSRNPLRVFDCKVDGDKDFVLAAPTIVDHLCEEHCASHFAAVREGSTRPGSRTCSMPPVADSTTTRTAFSGSPAYWR